MSLVPLTEYSVFFFFIVVVVCACGDCIVSTGENQTREKDLARTKTKNKHERGTRFQRRAGCPIVVVVRAAAGGTTRDGSRVCTGTRVTRITTYVRRRDERRLGLISGGPTLAAAAAAEVAYERCFFSFPFSPSSSSSPSCCCSSARARHLTACRAGSFGQSGTPSARLRRRRRLAVAPGTAVEERRRARELGRPSAPPSIDFISRRSNGRTPAAVDAGGNGGGGGGTTEARVHRRNKHGDRGTFVRSFVSPSRARVLLALALVPRHNIARRAPRKSRSVTPSFAAAFPSVCDVAVTRRRFVSRPVGRLCTTRKCLWTAVAIKLLFVSAAVFGPVLALRARSGVPLPPSLRARDHGLGAAADTARSDRPERGHARAACWLVTMKW